MMTEITFQVEPDQDGGFVANAQLASGSILTQGETIEELKLMINAAVEGYFFDMPTDRPQQIRLYLADRIIPN